MDFQNALSEFGISLNSKQTEQFELYYKLLVSWNEKMNLTAITDREEVYVKHFLDSLSFIKTNPPTEDFRLIDIGTGAGFPGIPIKILFPKAHITLMDSLAKRVTFLNEVTVKPEESALLEYIEDRKKFYINRHRRNRA